MTERDFAFSSVEYFAIKLMYARKKQTQEYRLSWTQAKAIGQSLGAKWKAFPWEGWSIAKWREFNKEMDSVPVKEKRMRPATKEDIERFAEHN